MPKAPSHIVAPILAEIPTVRSPATKVEIYLRACREIQYQLPKEAYGYATRARSVARKAKLTALEVHAQRMQGICRYAGNDFDGALEIFTKTLPRYSRLGDQTGLAKAHQNIGMALRALGRNEEALAAYRESEQLLHTIDDDALMAAVQTNLGSLWSVLDRHREALEAYSKCLTLAERMDDDRWRARITGNIADIYISVGDLETAAEWSTRSLELHRRTQDMMGVGLTLSNLGRVYMRLEQPDKALAALSEAVTVMTNLGDTHARARVMVVLAGVLRHKKRLAEARSMAQEALSVFDGTHDVEREIRCHVVLGECALDEGDMGEASRCFSLAQKRSAKTDNPRIHIDILHNQARLERMRNRWKRAHEHLERAIDVASRSDMSVTAATLHTELAELLESKGLLREALLHERAARTMQHRADSEMRAQNSQSLQMRLDIERAARERDRLHAEQQRLRFVLGTKEREINENARLVAQRNELLSGLTKELKKMAAKTTGTERELIKTVMSRIERFRRSGEQWTKVNEQFKEVHDDFLTALSVQFPSLTKTDIKVCSLLKLNLSSKEMAEIMSVAVHSLEQYRWRIRQKLGLKNSTNLVQFLQRLK